MEPSGRNQWQMEHPQKPLKQADPQPVATHGNRFGAHGKEGVDGSSPSDWLLAELGDPPNVVEVGAGTGKFTAQFVERNVRVLAVEPVAAMRERLSMIGPLVTPLAATAEDLPLETGSVDALVASQSLHWADVSVALTEFDRVLHPSGAVGLIWNVRDVAVPWQRDLDALLSELRGQAPHSRDGRWERAVKASVFESTRSETWRWSSAMDESGVLERVRSVSYIAAMPQDEQRKVDERILDLLREHGLNSSAEPIGFPYVTEAYVLQRRSEVAR
jgi:ubiquinone/menaquinone biosynthesis C-methylase UbiE